MLEEIKQNGKTILSSTDSVSIPVIFNNLTGRNFKAKEYNKYIVCVAFSLMNFKEGEIHLFRNGKQVDIGLIAIKK